MTAQPLGWQRDNEREACLRRELDAIMNDPAHQEWVAETNRAWADGSAMREASTREDILRALAEDR